MEKLISDIASYIDFMKIKFDLSASIHLVREYSLKCYITGAGKLMAYNCHINPYCLKIKSDKKRHSHCLRCQRRIFYKCRSEDFFEGSCFADVHEYIHAIKFNNEAIGFVSVSGYKSNNIRFEKNTELQEIYNANLKSLPLPSTLLDAVIPPLCRMTELLIGYMEKRQANYASQNNDYQILLHYFNEHHDSINLSELSRLLGRSKSFISHLFKKNNGHTILYYCNLLKIQDAKVLLVSTDMSITNIAFAVGFNDLSYFINTFKKVSGYTPLQWRKTHLPG